MPPPRTEHAVRAVHKGLSVPGLPQEAWGLAVPQHHVLLFPSAAMNQLR